MKKIDIVSRLHLLIATEEDKVTLPQLTVTREKVSSITDTSKTLTLYTLTINGEVTQCVEVGLPNYFNVALYIYNYLGKARAIDLLTTLEETQTKQ